MVTNLQVLSTIISICERSKQQHQGDSDDNDDVPVTSKLVQNIDSTQLAEHILYMPPNHILNEAGVAGRFTHFCERVRTPELDQF
jgi:hypothetical protein